MIRYNKSVIDWFLEQQLLSSDPVNNCILLTSISTYFPVYIYKYTKENPKFKKVPYISTTGFYNVYFYKNRVCTRLTRWVPLVEQELLTILEHPSSPPLFSGVGITRSLVLCVCFVDRCLSFCTFSFSHCVVCSSIYGF